MGGQVGRQLVQTLPKVSKSELPRGVFVVHSVCLPIQSVLFQRREREEGREKREITDFPPHFQPVHP